MAHKSMNTRDHASKKNEGARAKWMVDKKIGRPKQSYDLATKTYTKTFPSGVKI
jgi:hypothetical protein